MKKTIGRTVILLAGLLISCSNALPSATPLTSVATTQSTLPPTTFTQPTATHLPGDISVKFIWKVSLKMGGLTGIAVDQQGHIFASGYTDNTIYKLDSNGQLLIQWGGTGTENGQFRGPLGITVDQASNVYVADHDNNRIQMFNSNGQFLGQWGTPGDGDGQFDGPDIIAIDPEGYIYVTEDGNHRIQKFNNTGRFIFSLG
jgi:DNA-binding beta-propeller fold protein YncE